MKILLARALVSHNTDSVAAGAVCFIPSSLFAVTNFAAVMELFKISFGDSQFPIWYM